MASVHACSALTPCGRFSQSATLARRNWLPASRSRYDSVPSLRPALLNRGFSPYRAMTLDVAKLQSTELAGVAAQDVAACIFTLMGSFVWVKLFGVLADRNTLNPKFSRKLVHITTAPIVVLLWILYTTTPGAQYIAALVPLLNLLRLGLTGAGVLPDKSFVKSISRDGSASELLAGPLLYTVTLTIVTACFWRNSLISYLAVGIMAGGDGMADLVGRRFGQHKIPYNTEKSIEGSLAFVFFGTLMTLGLAGFFSWTGFLSLEQGLSGAALQILLVSVVCAFFESLPLTHYVDDNLVVPLTAVAMGSLLNRGIL